MLEEGKVCYDREGVPFLYDYDKCQGYRVHPDGSLHESPISAATLQMYGQRITREQAIKLAKGWDDIGKHHPKAPGPPLEGKG